MLPIHLLRAAHAIIHAALHHESIPTTIESGSGAQASLLAGMRLYDAAVCAYNWSHTAKRHKYSQWRRLCWLEQQIQQKVLALPTSHQRKRTKANRKLSCPLAVELKARSNRSVQAREDRHAYLAAIAASLTDDLTAYVIAYAAYQRAHQVAQQATQATKTTLALLRDWLLQYQ